MKSKPTFTWQGDARVIDALFERKENLQEGKLRKADGRTIGILFNGGGQKGALLGGIAMALEDAGLTNVFDHAVGVSTGALGVWYFCAGESHRGGPAYYNEGVEDNYIRQLRPWRILDLKIVDRIIRTEEPTDMNRLRAFPGDIHVGLTDAENGKGIFVDPRKFQDPLTPVITSCAVPFLDGKLAVDLGEKRYVDGGVAWPLPARYCVETLGCTDLLVLMTHPLQKARETIVDKIANIAVGFFYSRAFTQVFRDRLRLHNEEIEYLSSSLHDGVRICTLYPQHPFLSTFSENRKKLKEGEKNAKEFMEKFLATRMKK